MRKHILILGLILTVIGGYVFWTNHIPPREQNTLQVAPSPPALQQSPQQESMDVPRENVDTPPENTETLNKAQRTKQILHNMFSEEQLASNDAQKLLVILDSPEFAAFAETGQTSLEAFYDFLASQGLPVDKNAALMRFHEKFQKHFPGETPEAVEPQMRETLTNLFFEIESQSDYIKVINDFVADEKNAAWIMGRFPGREKEFGSWVVDLLKNAQNSQPAPLAPLPADTPVVVDTESFDDKVLENFPTESLESVPIPSTTPHGFKENDVLTESDIDNETEIRALLERSSPNTSEMPTETRFEKILRETFSPQQINSALQTLNRYGPEEGLRRLQRSDPDIATHLERLIERKQEND